MTRVVVHYNLDVIISVGYRVNSKRGVQFRQWATQRLKDYLVKGYAINEHRLAQKNQEIQFLHDGIRIMSRAIEEVSNDEAYKWLEKFSKGLKLLDDYDHEQLDTKGLSLVPGVHPNILEYEDIVNSMRTEFLHTEHVILVDKTKRIRGIYNGTLSLEMKHLVEDIRSLQEEND